MSPTRLRILIVGAWFPFPPSWGWATRVYHLARQLARLHDVTLLTYAGAADLESVALLDAELEVETVRREPGSRRKRRLQQLRSFLSMAPFETQAAHSRELQAALDRLCASGRYDIIQVESTLLWTLRFPPETHIVLDEHNIDYETYARMRESAGSPLRKLFYRLEEARVRRFEQRAWREASACVLTSTREERMVKLHAPGTPTAAVPNGVDVEFFRPGSGKHEPETIVFNGALDYRPNLEAAYFLADKVLPLVQQQRPHARVEIVGRGQQSELDRLRAHGVDVTGQVEDVRPHLERAAVVAVPIHVGSGTRFKVVEGLAMGRPMVSTTIGCEGIGVQDGEHLLVAESPEAFAASILQLLDDPSLGERLGRAGREFVEREYSWERAGASLDELYQGLTRSSRSQ